MIPFILLVLLLGAQIAGLRWWLTKEYYPLFFNNWAALLYAAVLMVDFFLVWLAAAIFAGSGTGWPQLLAFIGVFLFIVTLLYSLFLQWIIRQDLSDPK
jgi:hypothetical protein